MGKAKTTAKLTATQASRQAQARRKFRYIGGIFYRLAADKDAYYAQAKVDRALREVVWVLVYLLGKKAPAHASAK